ncbi:hypothetical protein DY052_06055 [Apilactobacillus timberlakei]|nr:hypothetical protein DY052_06055 [Apilactobacillus timberlakei]
MNIQAFLILLPLFTCELFNMGFNIKIILKLRLLIVEKISLKQAMKNCFIYLFIIFVLDLIACCYPNIINMIHINSYITSNACLGFILLNIFCNVIVVLFTMVTILMSYRYFGDMYKFFKYIFCLILLWSCLVIVPYVSIWLF